MGRLIYFYDEVLSHYMWTFGILILSSVLMYRQYRNPIADQGSLVSWFLISLPYAFTLFCFSIEGQAAPLKLPYAAGVVVVTLMLRKQIRTLPVVAFFLFAHAILLVLALVWAMYWGGLPEFSKVGVI